MDKKKPDLTPVQRITPAEVMRDAPIERVPEVDVQALLQAFLDRKFPTTLDAYTRDLSCFARFLGLDKKSGHELAAKLLLSQGAGKGNALALEYQNWLWKQGYAPKTINRRLAALRSLVKLARLLGMVSWTIEIQDVQSKALRDTRGPGRDGFLAMIEVLDGDASARAARDRAIVRLLYDMALRRAEVASLDYQDLDMKTWRAAVRGKGRTEDEWLSVPKTTREALVTWIAQRGPKNGPLFTSFDPARKGTGRLTGRSIHRIVKKLGQRAGVDERQARPHGLRHAAITRALELLGGDIRKASKFSRHKKIETLLIYDDNRRDLGGEVADMLSEDSSGEGEDGREAS